MWMKGLASESESEEVTTTRAKNLDIATDGVDSTELGCAKDRIDRDGETETSSTVHASRSSLSASPLLASSTASSLLSSAQHSRVESESVQELFMLPSTHMDIPTFTTMIATSTHSGTASTMSSSPSPTRSVSVSHSQNHSLSGNSSVSGNENDADNDSDSDAVLSAAGLPHHRVIIRSKRRKLEEIPVRERWRCPNEGCGREYKRTSTTSIGVHMEACRKRPALQDRPLMTQTGSGLLNLNFANVSQHTHPLSHPGSNNGGGQELTPWHWLNVQQQILGNVSANNASNLPLVYNQQSFDVSPQQFLVPQQQLQQQQQQAQAQQQLETLYFQQQQQQQQQAQYQAALHMQQVAQQQAQAQHHLPIATMERPLSATANNQQPGQQHAHAQAQPQQPLTYQYMETGSQPVLFQSAQQRNPFSMLPMQQQLPFVQQSQPTLPMQQAQPHSQSQSLLKPVARRVSEVDPFAKPTLAPSVTPTLQQSLFHPLNPAVQYAQPPSASLSVAPLPQHPSPTLQQGLLSNSQQFYMPQQPPYPANLPRP